jgi:hypothetical protein
VRCIAIPIVVEAELDKVRFSRLRFGGSPASANDRRRRWFKVKGGSTIVASIAHDIWLGSTLALATLVGLLTVVLAVSRRLREQED